MPDANFLLQLHEQRPAATRWIAIVKDGEIYVFGLDETQESVQELLRTFGRFASNPELSFSWSDAAILAQKFEKERREIYGE